MKKFTSMILVVFLTAISVYFFPYFEKSIFETAVIDEKLPDLSQKFSAKLSETDSDKPTYDRMESEDNELVQRTSIIEIQKMTQVAAVYQGKIEHLILKFDENLSDPAAREKIKEEIETNMAEYNKQVLPVVMSLMRKTAEKPK